MPNKIVTPEAEVISEAPEDLEPGPVVQVPRQEHQVLPVVATPAYLLQMAVEKGADLDKMQQLMDMQDRWDAKQAQKAYVAALASFSAEVPAIIKAKDGHNSKYAGLAETLKVIRPIMEKYKLSHSWKTDQIDGVIHVKCIVTHVDGHSEETTLSSAPDPSGKKNDIQAIGSAVSYLQRYTLYAILGLASEDDDGNKTEPAKIPLISDDQVLELEAMITDNDIDMSKVKAYMKSTLKVENFADVNVKALATLKHKIDATIKAKQA